MKTGTDEKGLCNNCGHSSFHWDCISKTYCEKCGNLISEDEELLYTLVDRE